MKRSEINALMRDAKKAFTLSGWTLPPNPRWDVTDFGLGDWQKFGLVLVNLADEPEYCEKLMYAKRGMVTPAHAHRKKKEDIIARMGTLQVQLWRDETLGTEGEVSVKLNGEAQTFPSGYIIELPAGWRVTMFPGVYHSFEPVTEACVIGEVSTANDDLHDNFFVRQDVGRYSKIEEDEPAEAQLIGEA